MEIVVPETADLRDPSLPPLRGLVVTDLDGTLLGSERRFSDGDLGALAAIGDQGYGRVIATGRSLFSYRRVTRETEPPVDYVAFSSGSGISVEPVPESHRFAHHPGGGACADYRRRLEWYEGHHRPVPHGPWTAGEASQLLVIADGSRGPETLGRLEGELRGYNLIRTTSPLDHESIWIEIFPRAVSKGRTIAWLADRLGLGPDEVLAVGNDYNDLDLLEWAGTSYVVENAPEELRERFDLVPGNDHGGVAKAIEAWRRSRGAS
jgi:hydroxymethylpyrimidine pyrophosphatase-like HAD family hydrolase